MVGVTPWPRRNKRLSTLTASPRILSRSFGQGRGAGLSAPRLSGFQPLRSRHSADQQAVCRSRQLSGWCIPTRAILRRRFENISQITDIICPRCAIPSMYWSSRRSVQITPEVAVFDREGHQLIYDGRIDDWYVDLGRVAPAPTTHELRRRHPRGAGWEGRGQAAKSGEWDATSQTWNKFLAAAQDGRLILLTALAAMRSGRQARRALRAIYMNGVRRAQVTFNRDIAPIIFHSCSTCHRPGEAAPFSLLTYSDVKKHARQIVGRHALADHASVAAGAAEIEVRR